MSLFRAAVNVVAHPHGCPARHVHEDLSVALFEQIEEFILYRNTTLIQSMIPTCDRLPKKPKSSMPTIVRENVYETRQKT